MILQASFLFWHISAYCKILGFFGLHGYAVCNYHDTSNCILVVAATFEIRPHTVCYIF